MPIGPSRRALLQLLAATGLAAALPGSLACGTDAPAAPARTARRVEKTVHVHLQRGDGTWLLPPEAHDRVELWVGGARRRLTSHDATSLGALRAAGGLRAGRRTPTHYATDVGFSVRGAQSLSVVFRGKRGAPVPLHMGVHVPTKDDRLRGDSYAPDPEHVVEAEDAAVWSVFQDPGVMALDPDIAQKVLAHIAACGSFALLTNRITELQWAISPEEAEEGYVGWVRGEYRKDPGGQRVPLRNPDGSPILDPSGAPVFEYSWVPHADVARLTLLVVGEVLERIHGDESLEDAGKFDTQPGLAVYQPIARPAPSAGAAGADAGGGLGEEAKATYTFPHNKKKREGRGLALESKVGSTHEFELTLTNYLPLGVCYGVSHFSDKGDLLGAQCFGYVPATFYPGISYAWTGRSKGEVTVTVPQNATKSVLWTTTPASASGDAVPGVPETLGVAFDLGVAGAAIGSFLLDFLFPGLMLSAGTGGKRSKRG